MNSPTLLVGLGGTGSKIVARVSELISDEQRRNISCVIFDTDANDIPAIRDHHAEIRIVQTSARMTVGEYLEADHHARDSWFPVNPPLDRKVLSEGAGQVRSISRLGFESAMRAGGMQPLHDAIQALYKVDNKKADQALRVIIVSSLAGGTGSGLIVPAAMYIRRYLENNFHQNANITRGFFILPEVFYNAIPADQRSNLKSNAYASLRELDAFLMKGNKTLSEEYDDSVRLEMPDLDTGGYSDYDVSPYDFCFLFDAQNANGEKLNSLEQYMDHAANIIYSMSIGPMNKRSNSSEDNVIRKLAREKGRNRYAGAGASRLIYPYDDICRLIGLNWARQSISEQWLQYDRQFEREQKKALARREEGYAAEDVNRSDMYVSLIDADSKKPFAASILREIERKEKEDTPLYTEYLTSLDEHIRNKIQDNEKLRNAAREASVAANGVELNSDPDENKDMLRKGRQALGAYQEEVRRFNEFDAKNIGYSVFEGAANEGSSDQPYFIETIIRNDGRYMHPNAMRYLLIKMRAAMQEERDTDKQRKEQLEKDLEAFKKNPWRQLDGDGESNSLDDYEAKGLLGRKKKTNAKLQEVAVDMQNMVKKTDELAYVSARVEVFSKGLAYLNSLIEGFEAFYHAFESQLNQIDERSEEICNKYTQAPGMTVRYVAASRNCLNQLVARYPYTGSMIAVDPDLAKRISDKIFQYARKDNKPNPSRYFSDLFEEQILAHYQEQANKRVAGELDQGILKAIELEADLVLDEDQKESRTAVDQYIRNVIEDTRALSTPFIEKPSELQSTVIDACAYNTSLKPRRGDESYEARLIQEELVAKGGQEDDDVDRNMIMFYQSYYGLRANSLSKFAPPKNSETHTRNGGEYFNAYRDLIKGIHPNSRLSQEITPHIDKRWHLAAKMPDLDEGNQIIEEYGISAAFYWALVLGLLDFKTESSGQKFYELKNIRLGLEDGALLIDGKHSSSKFHEVLEALALQPKLVEAIRNETRKETARDLEQAKSVKNGMVYRQMLRMDIPDDPALQNAVPEDARSSGHQIISLFDLPRLLKASMPAGSSNEKKLLDILTVAMKEAVNYITGFCSPEEEAGKIREFMETQMELYLAGLDELAKEGYAFYSDPLTTDTLDTAANFLEEWRLYDMAQSIRQKADQFKRK